MKKHTKIYLDFFDYGIEDFIPCEICERKAVDIAHIVPRSKFGAKRKDEQDRITNLAALCRDCHYKYDFENKIKKEDLQIIHNKKVEEHAARTGKYHF